MPSISYRFGIPGISLNQADQEHFLAFITRLCNQYATGPLQRVDLCNLMPRLQLTGNAQNSSASNMSSSQWTHIYSDPNYQYQNFPYNFSVEVRERCTNESKHIALLMLEVPNPIFITRQDLEGQFDNLLTRPPRLRTNADPFSHTQRYPWGEVHFVYKANAIDALTSIVFNDERKN
ncbi:hypothetical protein [Mycoavidus sp. B2-EB]|uniref:hypothetical protein n=1 Tax=Mycoavidus sp. B2-EB TaxID=2651972 RepID=UPI0016244647|nr:hypothetical protein [Mycoavidus sp. B2-EB]BBO60321.1 hypothetical protein MPB2EB_1461 [Mycoavidus sp. B2-EB]